MSVPRVLGLLALACVTLPALAQERVVIDPSAIVWIPGGAFTMGASDDDLAYAVSLCESELEVAASSLEPGGCRSDRFGIESPQRRVLVSTFGIDRVEVTNASYRSCVRAGACAPSSEREIGVRGEAEHPVVGVAWGDARAYCAWRSGRLPSEPEWEKAARGDDATRRFPWGRVYDSHLANHGRAPVRTDPIDGFLDTAPVGAL